MVTNYGVLIYISQIIYGYIIYIYLKRVTRQVIYSHPNHKTNYMMEKSNLLENYNELEAVVLEERALGGRGERFEKSESLSRSNNGLSLLSTSLNCKFISSRIIEKADLQDSSSLNARVHLPSTRAFDLTLL